MAKLTEKDALQEAVSEYNASVNNSGAKTLAGAGQLQQEVYVYALAGAAQPINRLTARGRIRGAVFDAIVGGSPVGDSGSTVTVVSLTGLVV